jgi:hypothetical protein
MEAFFQVGIRHPADRLSPIFWPDSLRESGGMPFQKLDNSASEWKPFGELGRAERIERPDRLVVSRPYRSMTV